MYYMYYFFGSTEKSVKSLRNEDCFLINNHVCDSNSKKVQSKKENFVVGIADGVGSTEHSGFASKYILEQIAKRKNQLSRSVIINLLNNAHTYLQKEFQGTASTVGSIVYGDHEHILIFHLGDTRVYKLTKRNFIQLTNDHTVVQQLVDSGAIGENMRTSHQQKHLILQSYGGNRSISIDIYSNTFEPGEKLLLTTDGIHDYLSIERIEEILRRSNNLETLVDKLIVEAKEQGSKDDLTALLVRYD